MVRGEMLNGVAPRQLPQGTLTRQQLAKGWASDPAETTCAFDRVRDCLGIVRSQGSGTAPLNQHR